jgi:hypothetical protein
LTHLSASEYNMRANNEGAANFGTETHPTGS